MSTKETAIRNAIAIADRLASIDPKDEAVGGMVTELQSLVASMKEQDAGQKVDVDFIGDQIKKLKSAAAVPAANYRRMYEILSSLEKAWAIAARPQNAAVRPKLAATFRKVAGIFAEVDTVQDLDKPLEQIEKAVHSLYGDQGKNSTYYFDRRNKGHHSEK